jgi:hypothetical protein
MMEMGIPKETVLAMTRNLKQAVNEAGGGKSGTAAVALKMGIPVAAFATFILSKDKKQQGELLRQYPQLGSL